MITLTAVYVLTGLVFLAFALLGLREHEKVVLTQAVGRLP